MYSNNLDVNFRVTYIQNICAGRVMIKREDVLSLLMNIEIKALAARNVSITHLDGPRL